MDRRRVLASLAATLLLPSVAPSHAQPVLARRLVLVHGRDQQGKDPAKLEREWLDALKKGGAKSGLQLPGGVETAFPFYGDLLDSYARQMSIPLSSEIQSRGDASDSFLDFQAELTRALQVAAGVPDSAVQAEFGEDPRERGPLNWKWVQATLRAIDRNTPGVSQANLEQFTRDVYLYITQDGVQVEVNRIVSKALSTEPTVVVGHSLGSVVAYNVMLRETRDLRVPLYVTVGCPLAVRPIRDRFRPLKCPSHIAAWYNAYDTRDVVSLYPLDAANFPVTPAIANNGQVRNWTDNRHGIVGYLDDAEVAKRILAVLG